MTHALPDVPQDAETFSFPRSFKWLTVVSTLFFGGLILISLLLLYLSPGTTRGLAVTLALGVFGFFFAYGWYVLRLTRDTVGVNNSGIWYLAPGKAPIFLDWRDVASVRARDYQQQLTVSDVSGKRVIRLEYQLADFERLRDLAYGHTRQSLREPRPTTFTRLRYITAVSIASGLFFGLLTGWSFLEGAQIASLFLAGFTILSFGATVVELQAVKVDEDAVRMHYLFWSRAIPYYSITNVALKNVNNQGNEVATVIVDRDHAKSLRLSGFREGSPALYDSLKTSWERASTAPRQSG